MADNAERGAGNKKCGTSHLDAEGRYRFRAEEKST